MTTPNLELDEWIADSNQPHVYVNTALRVLDCLTQMRALSMSTTTPPTDAEEGDTYIVPNGASGEWADHAQDVAMWIGGAWVYRTPRGGWEGWVVDDQLRVRFMEEGSPALWLPI